MSKINITYFGHSCFQVSSKEESVVFDPYKDGSVPGLKLPANIETDACFCSHDHADHNGAQLIHLTGRENPFPVSFVTTPHDHHDGTKRGMSKITFVTIHGITIAHLGDLGRNPTEEEFHQIAQADVVLIPCAGYYTISSKEAEKIIERLKYPSLKILMHFRDGKIGYEVQENIQEVMKNIPNVKRLYESEIEIDPANVPDEVITLQPKQ